MRAQKIKIAVSSCLLGNKVRFDGGHRKHRLTSEFLSDYFTMTPICPEVAIGMNVPREPVRLVNMNGNTRAVGVKNKQLDISVQLRQYAHKVSGQLEDVCGYIVKSKSPSCGMERVKLYSESGMLQETTSGIYTHELIRLHPLLPVEEEGRLMDTAIRESFFHRVFILHQWKAMQSEGITCRNLMQFHMQNKFLAQSHHEVGYRKLGTMIASINKRNVQQMAQQYISDLMSVLKIRQTNNAHCNVLLHIFGFFKKHISAPEKREFVDVVHDFRKGKLPRAVPVTLLQNYATRFSNTYIKQQHYLHKDYTRIMQLEYL